MTTVPDLDDSAEEIVNTIGINLTFFEDSSERHFTGIEIALGYLLLQWFAEGFVKGVGEGTGESFERRAAKSLPRLKSRVKGWFGRSHPTSESDAAATEELAAQAQTTAIEARQMVAEADEATVIAVAEDYQSALLEYLTGTGMLAHDAERIARTVRTETENQVRSTAH